MTRSRSKTWVSSVACPCSVSRTRRYRPSALDSKPLDVADVAEPPDHPGHGAHPHVDRVGDLAHQLPRRLADHFQDAQVGEREPAPDELVVDALEERPPAVDQFEPALRLVGCQRAANGRGVVLSRHNALTFIAANFVHAMVNFLSLIHI